MFPPVAPTAADAIAPARTVVRGTVYHIAMNRNVKIWFWCNSVTGPRIRGPEPAGNPVVLPGIVSLGLRTCSGIVWGGGGDVCDTN